MFNPSDIHAALAIPPRKLDNDQQRLVLWLFLQKLKVIGIKKNSINHMTALLSRTPMKVPTGVIFFAIVSATAEYLEVVPWIENEWLPG